MIKNNALKTPLAVHKLNFAIDNEGYLINSDIRQKIIQNFNLLSQEFIHNPEELNKYLGIKNDYYLLIDNENNSTYVFCYDNQKLIGSGRRAKVYLGQNIETGEFVAIKTYHNCEQKSLQKSDEDYFLKMFGYLKASYSITKDEFQKKISKKDEVINFIQVEKLHDSPSLNDIFNEMEKNKTLPDRLILKKIIQIFISAFQALKDFNKTCIHRDINNLGNILFSEVENKTTIIDFEHTIRKKNGDDENYDLKQMLNNLKFVLLWLLPESPSLTVMLDEINHLKKNYDNVLFFLKQKQFEIDNRNQINKTNLSGLVKLFYKATGESKSNVDNNNIINDIKTNSLAFTSITNKML